MTKTRNILIGLTGGALLFSGAAAMAQPPAPDFERPGAARGGPGGPGAMRGNPEARADRLRTELSITDAQEPAFTAWLETMTRGPENRPDPEAMAGLTTPERMARQMSQMQARVDATNRLYAVLSVEQKAAFDELPPGVVMGGGQPGPGMMARRGGRGEFGPQRGQGGQRGGQGPRLNNGVPGAYDPL